MTFETFKANFEFHLLTSRTSVLHHTVSVWSSDKSSLALANIHNTLLCAHQRIWSGASRFTRCSTSFELFVGFAGWLRRSGWYWTIGKRWRGKTKKRSHCFRQCIFSWKLNSMQANALPTFAYCRNDVQPHTYTNFFHLPIKITPKQIKPPGCF